MDKYFGIKSAPYIRLAKAKGGTLLELGMSLEAVVKEKDTAIAESRYEEAARHRAKEVDLIKEIEGLMNEDK